MRHLLVFCLLVVAVHALAQQAEPIIFKEKIHDFGEIDESGGNAEYEFIFTNNTGRPLRIVSVQPSCGCTTPDWSKDQIAPAKTGFIKASFDPKGRRGYFNKTLTVTTDYDGSQLVLQIKGQVLAPGSKTENAFAHRSGSLGFKTTSFNLGRIFINKPPVTASYEVFNFGDRPVRIESTHAPSHIKVAAPEAIGPKTKGKITITYDAAARDQYGFVSDNVEFTTDDEDTARKSFSVYATIEEYFPSLTTEEAASAPSLSLASTTIDLGRTTGDHALTTELKLKNTGKRNLEIRTLQSNCSCLTVGVKKMTINPGEEVPVPVSFVSQGRRGTHQKAITVYSNDPRNPVQRITLTAYIDD